MSSTQPTQDPKLPKEVIVTMGGATINYGKPPFDEPPIITPATQDPKIAPVPIFNGTPAKSMQGSDMSLVEAYNHTTPATKPLDEQIDRIIETLLVRPLQTPGAYAETNKLKDAIKALITNAEKQARRDQIMLDFEICSQETELDEMDIIMLREQMLEELEQS